MWLKRKKIVFDPMKKRGPSWLSGNGWNLYFEALVQASMEAQIFPRSVLGQDKAVA